MCVPASVVSDWGAGRSAMDSCGRAACEPAYGSCRGWFPLREMRVCRDGRVPVYIRVWCMRSISGWVVRFLWKRCARLSPAFRFLAQVLDSGGNREHQRMTGFRATPRHVAIILDGNRRWARRNGHGAAREGHAAGFGKIPEVLGWCEEAGIGIVTLWMLSDDNIQSRTPAELADLYEINRDVVSRITAAGRWQLRHIRDSSLLPRALAEVLLRAEKESEHVDGLSARPRHPQRRPDRERGPGNATPGPYRRSAGDRASRRVALLGPGLIRHRHCDARRRRRHLRVIRRRVVHLRVVGLRVTHRRQE